MRKRAVIVGIGGASCSGKTLLAKHLRRALASKSIIIHQDDFAPPAELVPYSTRYPDLQDWDDPPTCINWPAFRKALASARDFGILPDGHQSNDHLNKQVEVDIDDKVFAHWKEAFRQLETELADRNEEITWFIVDGFVLYWDPEVVSYLDTKVLLHVSRDLLKKRRDTRQTYALQNPEDAAVGGVWTDPPGYFDKIVYPAYVEAHRQLFDGDDVEAGRLRPEWQGRIQVVTPLSGSAGMTRAFEQAAEAIVRNVRAGHGSGLAVN